MFIDNYTCVGSIYAIYRGVHVANGFEKLLESGLICSSFCAIEKVRLYDVAQERMLRTILNSNASPIAIRVLAGRRISPSQASVYVFGLSISKDISSMVSIGSSGEASETLSIPRSNFIYVI